MQHVSVNTYLSLCRVTQFCFDYYFDLTTLCFLQEIKDLDELISEIGGELGKFAEEEKSQALGEIKELQVFCNIKGAVS